MSTDKSKASKPSKAPISFPCITVNQADHSIHLFSAPAKTLWNLLQINRKDEDKDEGYQRVLSPYRVKQISRFITAGNVLPLSILVSLDKAKISNDGKHIEIENSPEAGWVIDGQHRLAGAHESKIDIHLPVVAFISLSIEEQIKQFVTVNREAKGVPTSLYYDLLRQIPDRRTPAEIAKERSADIANDLKRDEDSPFFGRIVTTTSPKKGQISTNNFVRKVSPLILAGRGFLATYTAFEQKVIINNYYLALRTVFPSIHNEQSSVFFQTLGFGGLINALPTFFGICLGRYQGFRVEDAVKTFNEIKHFDFAAWKKSGTGSAAELQAGEDLQQELRNAFDTGDAKKGGSLRL